MGIYNYLFGRTGFGIGAGNQALEQPTTLPVDSIYAPRYNVKMSMNSVNPAYLKYNQDFTSVDLLSNGLYFAGTFALGALAPAEVPKPGNG